MIRIFKSLLDEQSKDQITTKLSLFLEMTFEKPNMMTESMNLFLKDDWPGLKIHTHSIKGRADFLSLKEFHDIAQQLQFSSRDQNVEQINAYIIPYLEYLQEIQKELHLILQQPNKKPFTIDQKVIEKVQRSKNIIDSNILQNIQPQGDKMTEFLEETEFLYKLNNQVNFQTQVEEFENNFLKDKYSYLEKLIEQKDCALLKREFLLMKKTSERIKLNNFFMISKEMQSQAMDENIDGIKELFDNQFKFIYDQTKKLIMQSRQDKYISKLIDMQSLLSNNGLKNFDENATLLFSDFIQELVQDLGTVDLIKYLFYKQKKEQLEQEIQYLINYGKKLGIINFENIFKQLLECLQKELNWNEKAVKPLLEEVMVQLLKQIQQLVKMFAQEDKVVNLEIIFSLKYKLKKDEQKYQLIEQSGLFEEKLVPTNDQVSMFNNTEYEDKELEQMIENYKMSFEKQQVTFRNLKPEDQETNLFEDNNLIPEEEQHYFKDDYLTKDLCLIF